MPPLRGLLLLAVGLLLLSACNVTKHLDTARGERLLVKNNLKLKADERLRFATRTALTNELTAQYRQKPNSRMAFALRPRLWLYYRYRDRKSKYAHWIMSKVAEPPTIYDDALTARTALNFENLMRQRGYLHARSTYETTFSGKYRARVTYSIDLGQLYTIQSVAFVSRDSNVLKILRATAEDSKLKAGAPLDANAFTSEKLRITGELKNRGYALFVPNYIEFNGDSSGTRVATQVEVLPPSDTGLHQIYYINNVAVFSSLVPDYSSIRRVENIGGISFFSSEPVFEVRADRLYDAILIHPGTLYRQDDFDKTTRKLNSLGVFRFVSVRYTPDTLLQNRLNVAISFSPNKRFTINPDLVLNSSNSRSSTAPSGWLFGIAPNLYIRNRNIFSGAELLQTNVSYNIEFDPFTQRRFIFAQEFKIQNQLGIPRFFDYLHFWRTQHRLHLGNRSLYYHWQEEGQTHINLTYNYLNLTDYYRYNLFNAAFGYDLRLSSERQYHVDHVGIDVLRPKTEPLFDDLVRDNEFLKRSFGNQLFTGFILRSFSYTYSGLPNRFGERWYFRFSPEISGLEVYLLNRLWEVPFGKQTWRLYDLDFSKYVRLDADLSYTREFRRGLFGILHVGSGIIVPYGDNLDAPYVKQFFVGGPSSIRAWRIREIGPGGYCVKDEFGNCIDVLPRNSTFYQTADFRFEFNAELRFPLIWWLKGAVFIDGGNIWTLEKDIQRENSQLRWDSYRNIAIGTGFGFRLDLDYFVIRFDLGLPLRRPYPVKGHYWITNRVASMKFSSFRPNLAVGYPF